MAKDQAFVGEEMVVNEGLGYPKAYPEMCRERQLLGPYSHGPPSTFFPYSLQETEKLRARELDQMFPEIDTKAKPTAKPKIFLSLLWKQLNHLGNAGFDPEVIRVDPYGNVVYYHADSASPLAWGIDHWFPLSRGGVTVPSNLRILQWQVCKKKHNKLEFLVPWWDLQLGISVNQFLSMFAASNSDFRHRAFSFLFKEAGNEELNHSQTVESHCFPQHCINSEDQLGLAPAAIVQPRRESYDPSSALRHLDHNRQIRPHSPAIAARKLKPTALKENESPDFVTNPYQAIVTARNSLKQREEAQKMQAEIRKLDDEVKEIRRENDKEQLIIQELELELIKCRRGAERCRRLSEEQSSYKTMLEKMIRDAMHQSVVYKEQVRLNQAANAMLMARLQAQRAICDESEKQVLKTLKRRDELERQLRPEIEQARKRSRIHDSLWEDRNDKRILYLPGVFQEEQQKASNFEVSSSKSKDHKQGQTREGLRKPAEEKVPRLEREWKRKNIQFPVSSEPESEEGEESRRNYGKGNVERWLEMLLENNKIEEEFDKEIENENEASTSSDIIRKMDLKYPQIKLNQMDKKVEIVETEDSNMVIKNVNACEVKRVSEGIGSWKSYEGKDRKERMVRRSESGKVLQRIPSSPSLILGVKKRADCIRKKQIVTSNDDDNGDDDQDPNDGLN